MANNGMERWVGMNNTTEMRPDHAWQFFWLGRGRVEFFWGAHGYDAVTMVHLRARGEGVLIDCNPIRYLHLLHDYILVLPATNYNRLRAASLQSFIST